MADVGRGDRAQLFLVGALSLAVLFVVLALLMNTAIYTENIATRETGSGTADAIRYAGAVRSGAGGLVSYANRHNNESYAALDANVTAGVGTVSDATSVHHVYTGSVANASLVDTTNGTRMVQEDDARNFTAGGAADGTEHWTLAAGAADARAFRLNVSRSDLATASDASDSVFHANVTDGTNTWHAYVYNDTSTGAVTVTVKNGTDPISTASCTGPTGGAGERVVVDLTRGTVAGEPCPLLDFATGVSSPYDVRFENGHLAAGTYGLVVHGTSLGGEPDPSDPVFYDDGTGNSPYVTPAVYSVTLDVAYEGPRISYRTTVTVAPEAPR